MPLRPLPYREVQRKLLVAGFEQATQEGSHVKFIRKTGDVVRTAVVPKHREIAVGTLRSIIRQAGIGPDEWDLL